MLPGSFGLHGAALSLSVLRCDQETDLGMFPSGSTIWIGQLGHAANLQTVPWSLCLLVYLQTKHTLRVQVFVWAKHQVIWRDYLSVRAAGHGEAETLGMELAPLLPSVPHRPTAQAPCHSQLLFSTLQLGGRLIWLELERHRWYQGTVSKHTSCRKPWSFGRCLQNGSVNSLYSGKGKRCERQWVLKLLILSQCNFFPFLF